MPKYDWGAIICPLDWSPMRKWHITYDFVLFDFLYENNEGNKAKPIVEVELTSQHLSSFCVVCICEDWSLFFMLSVCLLLLFFFWLSLVWLIAQFSMTDSGLSSFDGMVGEVIRGVKWVSAHPESFFVQNGSIFKSGACFPNFGTLWARFTKFSYSNMYMRMTLNLIFITVHVMYIE